MPVPVQFTRRTGLSLVALASLAACAVPTELPKYTTLWSVPAKTTSIAASSFLPAGVTATPDNAAFVVSMSPSTSTITRQLGQDCPSCVTNNGTTMAKPSFAGGGTSNLTISASVASALLVRDTLTVTITNGFNFDPIRPSATARGSLIITVKSGATTIGTDSINGTTTSLAAGAKLVRKIPLNGTMTGANGLQIVTMLNSPVGDPVAIDASRSLIVSGSAGPLFVANAQVNLASQSVTAAPTELDLSGIDSTITKHAESGSLVLAVDNPFAVTGTLSVSFIGGAFPITKSVALATGKSAPSIDFTKSEINALFGHQLSVTLSGAVSGNGVTVAPGQGVSVASHLLIGVNVGGGTN